MDRRQFLAASGLAATTPTLALLAAPEATTAAETGLFQAIDFSNDGLGLTPREYALRLHEMASTQDIDGDNYSNGGVIAQLEKKFAQLLGKEAAVFVPTGTLANHLAVRKLAGNDRRVLVQAESHFFNDSGDCAETLSGINLIPLATGRSTIGLDEVRQWVERSQGGRVPMKVGAIAIESPVRRRHHEMVDFAELQRVCTYAREQGIRLHLDGARLFNLPLHSGKSVHEYTALFDTVFVSLWKHFNGTYGAILAGDASFIDGLYHTRRMFGGSLPHAWPGVAVALQYADTYEADYAKAWKATDEWLALLQKSRHFKAQKIPNGTSRFLLTVSGVSPDDFAERLGNRGVHLSMPKPGTGEFAMQVNPTILRTTPEALARVFVGAAKG